MKKIEAKNKSVFVTYIILFIILILPLVIGFSRIPFTEAEQVLYDSTHYNDLFAKVRGTILIIVAVIALLSMVGDYILSEDKKIKFDMPILLVLSYMLFIVLSTLFSDYRTEALRGVVDRYEGMWVLLSYCIVFITSYIIAKKDQLPNLKWPIALSSGVVSIIGWFQLFGYNLLNSKFFLRIILGDYFQYFTAETSKAYHVYSTLGNPNFVGNYLSLTIPFLFLMILKQEINKTEKKSVYSFIILSLSFVLNIGFLIAARSLAGYVGIIFSITIFILFLRGVKYEKKRLVYIVSLILFTGVLLELASTIKLLDLEHIVVLLISFMFALVMGLLFKYINTKKRLIFSVLTLVVAVSGVVGWVVFSDWDENYFVNDSKIYFENVAIDGNEIIIEYLLEGLHSLRIGKDGGGYYHIFDSDEKAYYNNKKDIYLRVGKDPFRFKVILKEGFQGIVFKRYNMAFVLIGDEFRFISSGNNAVKIDEPDVVGIKGLEKLGSGRAYIWSRTIPMIKDTMFLGVGPDVFLIEFPQHDVVGKLNSGKLRLIVDKPHNWYLQMAINTGGISLVIVLSLLLLMLKLLNTAENYGVDSIMIYSYSLGIVAYYVTALFNDSVVMVAPTFWAFYGLAFGLLAKHYDLKLGSVIEMFRS